MRGDPPEYLLEWLRHNGWSESDGEWSRPGFDAPDVGVWEAIESERGRSDAPIVGTCPGCGPGAAFDLKSGPVFDTPDAGQHVGSRLVRVCRRCGYEDEVARL